MSFKINPAKEAVTETRIIVPAQEATVTVTLPLREALILAALQGHSTGSHGNTLHANLRRHPAYDPLLPLVKGAIAYDLEYQKGNVSLHKFEAEINAVLEGV